MRKRVCIARMQDGSFQISRAFWTSHGANRWCQKRQKQGAKYTRIYIKKVKQK